MVTSRLTQAAISTLLLLLSGAVFADEPADGRPTIQWYMPNFPPVVIRSGPEHNQGWADRREQLLAQRMPALRHEEVESSGTRFMEDVKVKPNVFNPPLLRTPERENDIEFFLPPSRLLSHGSITPR